MPGCYFFTPDKVLWWKVIATKSGGCFGTYLCFYGQYSALCVVYRRPFHFEIASWLQGTGWGRSMWERVWIWTELLHDKRMQISASFFCSSHTAAFVRPSPFRLLIRWWKGNVQVFCLLFLSWKAHTHAAVCFGFLEAAVQEWIVKGNVEEKLNLGTSWMASSSLWVF